VKHVSSTGSGKRHAKNRRGARQWDEGKKEGGEARRGGGEEHVGNL